MKLPGYYSAGEFMKLTHITKKTIRYYDERNILKPSYVDPITRTRFYTDADLLKLQQILLLKSLGFSLDDIKEITINTDDTHFMANSFNLQLKLVEDRVEQLQIVAQTLKETIQLINDHKPVDWSNMLELIRLMGMETQLKKQYQNASNISTRINLHTLYSQNKQGWFPWIFQQITWKTNSQVLEIGCGDGSFWNENVSLLPQDIHIILSDLSEGMLRDTRRILGEDSRFSLQVCNCENLPFENHTFDCIVANHVLFYCEDMDKACSEIKRVLKPGGVFLCSTYGEEHMKEINQLVSDFDSRIILSAEKLYEKFGKENGATILSPYFSEIEWRSYPDSLIVNEAEPLISYVLSCHGNQNQFILDHYKEFRAFVKARTDKNLHITKDAGLFICQSPKK